MSTPLPASKMEEIEPVFVENVPEQLDDGKIYISKKYKVAVHKCACGCGEKVVTPLGGSEWILAEINGKVSLSPSIGNWIWERPNYHAHYFIKENKILWC